MKKMLFVMMLVSAITLNAQVSTGSITGTRGNFRNHTFTQVAPTIRDYQLVESRDVKKLTAAVKVLMQQGWVPFGSVSMVYDPKVVYGIIYVQTMVKY